MTGEVLSVDVGWIPLPTHEGRKGWANVQTHEEINVCALYQELSRALELDFPYRAD